MRPEISVADHLISSKKSVSIYFKLSYKTIFCRDSQPGGYDHPAGDRDNCELSDRDTRDLEMDNPQYFDNKGTYDFYERGLGGDGDCLDGKCCHC